MATSEFHTEKRSNLKRFLEINEDLSNKRVKMCTETGRFYEVGSNKNVITVERNSSDYWRSSYQRYRLSYYGGYRGRNRCIKNRIGSKKKEEMARKKILRMLSIVRILRIPRTLRIVKIPKILMILRILILSQSRNSLIGNRPSARMQSTKDSRSVFSMVLKLLLKKVKFLSSIWRR